MSHPESVEPDVATAAAPSGAPAGIDPRAPRFSAAITAVLLLTVVVLSVAGLEVTAWALLTALSAIFLWGAVAGVKRHPFGVLYRTFVRPRLAPPTELEDPRPPTFAQLVGFIVTIVGVVLGLFGVEYAVAIAAGFAFIAAFLNAVFDYCLGCQIYLLLVRARLLQRA
ncbi:DUF4395 domain-containing protein [Agromyces aureus]|uniref:DUF4395 domain-containing protein n=1 Tax=Agromyces aureus TaxID=453304 RepID=A0A191WGR3_9MICO|nr:DUF4395 domain-containing protein [Agromyces aureus]ANJ27446.1 hypothetical protein ATC03_12740 [Agromyces aureus]